ncbi:hypothetical protein [Bradyrhizobium stylosanthis]|uniref:hypothetical protein n=1 Tax=Bradyrhizobium stylosanthis TaxID=1803665 RepID=UPI0007C478DE|nr:hypothetical protein [Bradyrhizobium stylosanthis]
MLRSICSAAHHGFANLSNGVAIEAVSTDLGPFITGRCVDLGRAGPTLGISSLGFVMGERLD